MKAPLLTMVLRYEDDVVTARQRARQIAQLLQFDNQDQTRIATAVSEIARNALSYGDGGRVEFSIDGKEEPLSFVVEVTDQGPGIANLGEVLSGQYQSTTGMGIGLVGAKRLMDGCDIASSAAGTTVTLRKNLPRSAPMVNSRQIVHITAQLEAQIRSRPSTLIDELTQQNHELVGALAEVESKQQELSRLNAELFDTNRGVLALYAELEAQSEHVRRANELKTRFLSNMSHEFRTPLNSILALTQLLNERVDGELNHEQERQIGYIRRSATDLLDLVNDLLDLAKVEAGKIEARPIEFSIDGLFGALRGILRPMLASSAVDLLFEDATALPVVFNDEAKVSQILRNLLSNAIKFTPRGEIRASATYVDSGRKIAGMTHAAAEDSVLICVADTGIGIDTEDHERIFEEFAQIDNPLQDLARGTGLGLPLCRKLAVVVGGEVWVQSTLGGGSRFYLLIPLRFRVPTTTPSPAHDLPPGVLRFKA